jgi:hypothetical protein
MWAVRLHRLAREVSGGLDRVNNHWVSTRTDAIRGLRNASGIIEPVGTIDAPEAASLSKKHLQAPYFEDTHFPVNRTLSEAFGAFLGNENATYIVVAIRKAAKYQQQVSSR